MLSLVDTYYPTVLLADTVCTHSHALLLLVQLTKLVTNAHEQCAMTRGSCWKHNFCQFEQGVEVRGGGSCLLGVDSRAWEGKSNPNPKKIFFFAKNIFTKYIFVTIFSPQIFLSKYSNKKYFQKISFTKNNSKKIPKIYFFKIHLPNTFSKEVGAKPLCCPQGLG